MYGEVTTYLKTLFNTFYYSTNFISPCGSSTNRLLPKPHIFLGFEQGHQITDLLKLYEVKGDFLSKRLSPLPRAFMHGHYSEMSWFRGKKQRFMGGHIKVQF